MKRWATGDWRLVTGERRYANGESASEGAR